VKELFLSATCHFIHGADISVDMLHLNHHLLSKSVSISLFFAYL